ncbi:hypothetical protein SODALDRAFT_323368 [Sodiomyces alkalinus F11]|uniref:Uncharacterized protein n=1 Tax=Sodiomyces alkalinus (strain CBS 110278 / VKM F-3762 / F11) TaxID=1314773 RepID=A0A3N2Q020_SODAK|nr:hypothetical protein SODALDRAFT_323368 [Sodiomyces alkalinus F11]ROT40120.1 hypothetical protein SODALDRAFT_323368 [Sodiomyces alkalinus F11]
MWRDIYPSIYNRYTELRVYRELTLGEYSAAASIRLLPKIASTLLGFSKEEGSKVVIVNHGEEKEDKDNTNPDTVNNIDKDEDIADAYNGDNKPSRGYIKITLKAKLLAYN